MQDQNSIKFSDVELKNGVKKSKTDQSLGRNEKTESWKLPLIGVPEFREYTIRFWKMKEREVRIEAFFAEILD